MDRSDSLHLLELDATLRVASADAYSIVDDAAPPRLRRAYSEGSLSPTILSRVVTSLVGSRRPTWAHAPQMSARKTGYARRLARRASQHRRHLSTGNLPRLLTTARTGAQMLSDAAANGAATGAGAGAGVGTGAGAGPRLATAASPVLGSVTSASVYTVPEDLEVTPLPPSHSPQSLTRLPPQPPQRVPSAPFSNLRRRHRGRNSAGSGGTPGPRRRGRRRRGSGSSGSSGGSVGSDSLLSLRRTRSNSSGSGNNAVSGSVVLAGTSRSRASSGSSSNGSSVPSGSPTAWRAQHTLRRDRSVSHDMASTSNKISTAVQQTTLSATTTASWTVLLLAGLAVVVGGCASFVMFEVLVTVEKDCANMITFFQLLSTVLTTFSLRHLTSRTVPLYAHIGLAALNVGVGMFANAALSFAIPVPLFLILRNGNLVAAVIAGRIAFGRTPTRGQLAAVAMITVGIIATTWFGTIGRRTETAAEQPHEPVSGSEHPVGEAARFLTGVGLVAASVCCTTMLSLGQEAVFKRYKRVHEEVLFYTSLLGLPAFATMLPSFLSRLQQWLYNPKPELVTRGGLRLPLPVPLVAILVLNLAFSAMCKRGVFSLLGVTSSLTTTIVITIYRLASLLISLLVFNSPPWPPAAVWAGAAMVMGGSAAYALSPRKPPSAAAGADKGASPKASST